MGAVTNLYRRGAIYYYRRRVRWSAGKTLTISVSLRTARLVEARRRAIQLAACCEAIHADMERAMREQPISPAQRDEVYRRRLIALASLEASMVAGGYAEAVQFAFGEALDIVVAASDILAAGGCPSLDDYADLDDLLVSRFGQLTLLQRIDLRAAFEKLGDPRGHWEAVTRDALLSVGAPVNSANQHIIYQTLRQAKSYAAAVFNARRFVKGGQDLLPSEPQPPDLRCFDNQYAQTAEQPLLHLFNMSLEWYLPETGRAPGDTATNWITNPGAQSCRAPLSGD